MPLMPPSAPSSAATRALQTIHQLPLEVPVLRVLIIRHGEKPAVGDNLSCAGLNRALALPDVFAQLLPAPPEFTYVPLIGTDSQATSTARMFQTITPYAVLHNLIVNSDHDVADVAGLAADLRHKRGTALVVWEHHHIPGIVAKLGIKAPPAWPENDFDSIWRLDFAKESKKGNAKHPTLTHHHEHIQPSPSFPSTRRGK